MFVRKILVLLLCVIQLSGLNGQVQSALVKASLDTNSIEIGDQLFLNLSIEKPVGYQISFPVFKDTIVSGLEIVDIMPVDTEELKNNKHQLIKRIRITAFDPGIISIPAFGFVKGTDTLFSNSLELTVNPVKLDSAEIAEIDTSQVLDIFDIKGPIDTPFTFDEFIKRFYPYILGLFGLAIIIALAVYIFRRISQNKPLIKLPEKPKEPAHIVALRNLDILKQKKLWQSGYEKEYYLELTDIIRQYIEDRFGVHTFERTTFEILESIASGKILKEDDYLELKSLLSLADLAKFAKYKPLPNENELCLKNSYSFVENTKILEVPELIEMKNDSDNTAGLIVNQLPDNNKV